MEGTACEKWLRTSLVHFGETKAEGSHHGSLSSGDTERDTPLCPPGTQCQELWEWLKLCQGRLTLDIL